MRSAAAWGRHQVLVELSEPGLAMVVDHQDPLDHGSSGLPQRVSLFSAPTPSHTPPAVLRQGSHGDSIGATGDEDNTNFFFQLGNDMLVNLTRAGHASALRVVPRSVLLHGASMSLLTVVRRACTAQSKLLQLAAGQSLQFTGMGGPMGVYENYDTCDPRARPLVPAAACCRPLLQALQALPGAQSRGRDRDAPCGCARRPGRRPCSAYCVRGWGRALGHLGGTIRGHLFFS